MSLGEAPKSDEARKMCERAEYYFEKIRKRELRFTPEADASKVYDPQTKDHVPMPLYAGRLMGEYDREKVEEEEIKIKMESSPDVETVGFYIKPSHYQTLLDSSRKIRFLIARNFLSLIDEALTNPTPLIEEGPAFFAKLEQCENEKKKIIEERDSLDVELKKLSPAYIRLEALYEDCQRKLHIQSLGQRKP